MENIVKLKNVRITVMEKEDVWMENVNVPVDFSVLIAHR